MPSFLQIETHGNWNTMMLTSRSNPLLLQWPWSQRNRPLESILWNHANDRPYTRRICKTVLYISNDQSAIITLSWSHSETRWNYSIFLPGSVIEGHQQDWFCRNNWLGWPQVERRKGWNNWQDWPPAHSVHWSPWSPTTTSLLLFKDLHSGLA